MASLGAHPAAVPAYCLGRNVPEIPEGTDCVLSLVRRGQALHVDQFSGVLVVRVGLSRSKQQPGSEADGIVGAVPRYKL